ncbi:hypothetical protein OS493_006328 [Desmophyllum pertusum]|uniref:Uncharacterized protein n=1 Tax=Desmophyllum pertusum TaxID=174260 RepID=A0A9X0DAG7_9CNID|nr:hypothetical protein OS493_006328 [Desmophyllum pertusum]
MEITWKLYFACWFLGAAVQSAVFFSFNAADYFNYFFPDNYKPEVYVGVTVGVGASLGAVSTVTFPPKTSHLTVLLVTLTVSVFLLVAEVVITPLDTGILSTPARFGSVLAIIFASTVVQNVGGGALYSFVGEHFPKFGVHAAQSGACCLIAILRAHVGPAAYAKRLNVIDRGNAENREDQSLLRSDEFSDVSRKKVIRNNWAALATICLTLVLPPNSTGITTALLLLAISPTRLAFFPTELRQITPPFSPTKAQSSDKTGWFIVILFGCYSVADAIGKNLPILGIIYNKKSILCNCLVQLIIAIPILLIYFEPCISGLQADWVAYLTVGLLGLVNGYGLCAAMMLLAPGKHGKKHEEGLATSIGFMFLQRCCLIAILREHVGNAENREDQSLLRSDEFSDVSRKKVIRNNWAALATICLTLVISNSLFPGITSQFHGNYNCITLDRNLSDSSGYLYTNRAAANDATVSPTKAQSSDKTGWFIVILFGCYSVADAIGKNLPILGIIYNKKSILCNCLVQLVIAIPILLIYFEPCIRGLQADWVAYLTVGLLGLVNGYGTVRGHDAFGPREAWEKARGGPGD